MNSFFTTQIRFAHPGDKPRSINVQANVNVNLPVPVTVTVPEKRIRCAHPGDKPRDSIAPRGSIVLLLLSIAMACEPSPYPEDIDALAERWTTTRFAFLERCVTPHTLQGDYGRAAEPTLASIAARPESPGEIDAFFRAQFLDRDRQLDRDNFNRCMDAHDALAAQPAAMSCPADPRAFYLRARCALVFVGALQEGEGCLAGITTDRCAPGLFCDAPNSFSCGRCAPDRSAGFGGGFDPCRDDPYCGVTAAPSDVGAPCERNCGEGFYASLACIDGVCVQRRVIDIGGACDSIQEQPWEPRSVRHCRDQDFGATTCAPLLDGDEPQCIALISDDPPTGGGVFIPGAAVVSSAVGGAALDEEPSCAP